MTWLQFTGDLDGSFIHAHWNIGKTFDAELINLSLISKGALMYYYKLMNIVGILYLIFISAKLFCFCKWSYILVIYRWMFCIYLNG